ncbi:hypothetical protein OG2516_00120 [Oceanicola granulosus HTCC2516]|uniref:Uncharacterized protein n=1 Tax=Oceanicola granulosus (strain ATCC BAA-861 / DSM 15982 / KCTC 12143 / HTCC2516) TaxID=314256 RepID=Q2CDW7_OCEGH|nr:hypothetical protein [Oceanicola granulosus]EAR50861.1 hypothetical protein OG2516_00120 [Oceanicola granulosus HTCC2516]
MIRLAAAFLLLAAPASAQSIAFAQAVEQSDGMAVADTADAAIAEARAQCVEGGAMEQDCLIVACDHAGYSIDVFVQHQAGNHWHETFCGLPDEDVARAVGETLCDTSLRPYIMECMLTQIWDWNGNPIIEY